MAIPFNTTYITIIRSTIPPQQDKYDPIDLLPNPATKLVITGIRAVVTVPSMSTNLIAGQKVDFNTTLTCDPCDLRSGDIVTESAGYIWTVLSAEPFAAFFISGMKASMRRVTGFAP